MSAWTEFACIVCAFLAGFVLADLLNFLGVRHDR
jgi:hypothetical protein